MFTSGVIERIHQKWLPKLIENCLNQDSSTAKPIKFEMVVSAFVILVFFFVLACIILICEKIAKARLRVE